MKRYFLRIIQNGEELIVWFLLPAFFNPKTVYELYLEEEQPTNKQQAEAAMLNAMQKAMDSLGKDMKKAMVNDFDRKVDHATTIEDVLK